MSGLTVPPWSRPGAIATGVLLGLLSLSVPGPAVAAPVLETLYSFTSGLTAGVGGYYPRAGLIMDTSGALYGTDYDGGGAHFSGVVFRLAPAVAGATVRAETVLHSFTGGRDGGLPLAGLAMDKSGALYGTTTIGGGTLNGGVAFKLTPAAGKKPWPDTVLHAFTGGTDGGYPFAGLIVNKSGVLYGATQYGGAHNWGAVVRLTPPVAPKTAWTETVLYSFTGDADGQSPEARLVLDRSGALYGTAEAGGTYSAGVVFKLTPPIAPKTLWTESVLYSFRNPNGENPINDLIMDKSGALYGTTPRGGAKGSGVVFKLTPPAASGGAWTETLLHEFGQGTDGATPYAGLIMDGAGALYGTTYQGGTARDGTVFKLTPPSAAKKPWRETVLHDFTGRTDGSEPYGDLIMDKPGALYGTTRGGGTGAAGVVYKVTP